VRTTRLASVFWHLDGTKQRDNLDDDCRPAKLIGYKKSKKRFIERKHSSVTCNKNPYLQFVQNGVTA
jgi:hypothetical protein